MKEFEDSAAALANASIEFFDTHEENILHCMTMYEGVGVWQRFGTKWAIWCSAG
jgi:hypothetical protein